MSLPDYLPPIVAARYSRRDMIGLLEDLLYAIKRDDVYEGSLSWTLPGPDAPSDVAFEVSGCFRIGRSVGEPKLRVVAGLPPAPLSQKCHNRPRKAAVAAVERG